MSVDLPAPFSPTMPWIVPAGIARSTLLLACTAPKCLSMPISSTAGVAVGDALAALVAAAVGSDNKAAHVLGWPPYWVE